MSRHRSVSALLVDVPAGHAALLVRALEQAGWHVRALPVQGAEALSAAIAHRGWQVVLYGGEGRDAVPSSKALALVRMADPHVPFIAVSPHMRRGDLSAVLRALPSGVPSVSDAAELPRVLTRELEKARMRRRVGGAHRLLGVQQAIADLLAAGLEPGALCDRVLATLGESLGWTAGAIWGPEGALLRCATVWHEAGARAPVAALANATLEQTYAAGQGLPGRVWAFRRPVWLADVQGDALRAGLVTGAAFPIAHGDECMGVLELYASDAREPNAEVSAMFATVGSQVAAYLARRRRRARARRAFDGADALVVALDPDGRVEIANGTACRALGFAEDELLGREWFGLAGVAGEREAFARWLAGEGVELPGVAGASWRWSVSRDSDGTVLGAVGWGEVVIDAPVGGEVAAADPARSTSELRCTPCAPPSPPRSSRQWPWPPAAPTTPAPPRPGTLRSRR